MNDLGKEGKPKYESLFTNKNSPLPPFVNDLRKFRWSYYFVELKKTIKKEAWLY